MAPTVPPQEVPSSSRRPAAVLTLVAALACGGDETIPPDPPEPTRVTVSPSSLDFAALQDTARLSAQVHDQFGDLMADAAVTWASSDASVASVGSEGLVRSVGDGEAVVVAKAGSASDSATVTVAQVVSSVGVSPAALEFSALGDTLGLEAEPVDANGHAVEGVTVTWASGDAAVASVDSDGLVQSVGNGEAVVTATAGSVSGTAEATVAQVVTAVRMSPSALEFSALGDTLRLGAEAVDANGYPVEGAKVTWASDDTAVAMVDTSGLVRSVGNGEAAVTGTTDSVSGTAEVMVAQVVTAVTVSPAALEFSALGDTLRLGAEAVDANGHAAEGATVIWVSGDTAVAVVDASGLVRSVGNGDAVVSATADSVSGAAEVTVGQVVGAVHVSPKALEFSALAERLRLDAEPVDSNGHPVEGAKVTWESGNTAVAVLDAWGLVRSVGNGEATVTATAGSASDTAYVTVAQVASVVSVSPDTARLTVLGGTLRLTARARDKKGHWIRDASFTWTSDALSVATVDSAGLVEAVGYGAATVTATLDSASGSAVVRVEEDLDRAALIAFYEATGGPSWWANYKWLTDAPLGEWQGIDVDEEGRVTEIILESNRLAGPLPPELANLTELQVLRLQDNRITGGIPSWLGQLRRLTRLDLARNQFTGEIPPELGKLSELDALLLGANMIEGRIPVELGDLSSVTSLSVASNKLSGPIPSELGDLSTLTNLNLHGNGLSGPIPPELGRLSDLLYLRLEVNNLEGELPPELGNLRRLKWLFLQFNSRLTGSIRVLGNLSSLEHLALSYCGFYGSIPPELGNLSKLHTLIVAGSKFTGTIPGELGKMSSLEQLLIIKNKYITGPIPPELADLPRLRYLGLEQNDLTGPIPPELAAAPKLVSVFLGGNRLSGPIPPELGDAPKLALLSLYHNELSGPVPPEIGNIETLRGLNLTGNTEMTGVLPTTMTALKNLRSLSTSNTGLCAPDDSGFRKWLRGLVYQRVALCDPPAAYLVQAVQSRPHPVPLIAEEPALLRVFVTATKKTDARIPPVRATFYQDDEKVHTVTVPAKSVTIPTEVDESSLDLSSNAEIPDSVLEPDLEMVIEIDPDSTLDADLLVTKRIPEEGRASVEVNDMPLLDLTVIPLLWEEDPDSTVLDLTEDMTDGDTLFTDTHTLLPVGDMDVTVHETVWSSTNDIFTLLREVTALRTAEGGTGHWMGIMPNAEGAAGVAHAGGGWTTVVKPRVSTVAHELGHNMSLFHAPCGNPKLVDGGHPYRDGSIGAWGYDFRSEKLVPPSRKDLMSYCPPRWISDYHFSRALGYRLRVEEPQEYRGTASSVRSLLLWGGADRSGVPFLEPAFVVDAPPALPTAGGEYRLVGRDGDGGELFALDFDMRTVTHGDGRSSFAFALPVRSGWDDALMSLTITGPGGSATLSTESDVPMALLRDPRTGRMRGFVRGQAASDLAAGRVTTWSNRGLEALFSSGIPESSTWHR